MTQANVPQEDKEQLADFLQEQASQSWWHEINWDRERALIAVKMIIEAGWVPKDHIEYSGDPGHRHKFVPMANQPKGRRNLECICGIKMFGPDNG